MPTSRAPGAVVATSSSVDRSAADVDSTSRSSLISQKRSSMVRSTDDIVMPPMTSGSPSTNHAVPGVEFDRVLTGRERSDQSCRTAESPPVTSVPSPACSVRSSATPPRSAVVGLTVGSSQPAAGDVGTALVRAGVAPVDASMPWIACPIHPA